MRWTIWFSTGAISATGGCRWPRWRAKRWMRRKISRWSTGSTRSVSWPSPRRAISRPNRFLARPAMPLPCWRAAMTWNPTKRRWWCLRRRGGPTAPGRRRRATRQWRATRMRPWPGVAPGRRRRARQRRRRQRTLPPRPAKAAKAKPGSAPRSAPMPSPIPGRMPGRMPGPPPARTKRPPRRRPARRTATMPPEMPAAQRHSARKPRP